MSDPNREEFKGTAWHKKDNGLFVPETYSLDEKAEVTKKTLREQVKWVLDNISLVLLLPSFLGALWQILELSSINVAYIRFFSVTQIPVDGILILFLIVLIIVMGKAVIGLLKSAFENKVKGLEDEEFVKKLRKNLNFHIKKAFVHGNEGFFVLIEFGFRTFSQLKNLPKEYVVLELYNDLYVCK